MKNCAHSEAYTATGFQGGLQWYRCQTGQRFLPDMQLLAGRTIDIPSMFIAGASDWGVYQKPGDFERMQRTSCTRMHRMPPAAGGRPLVQQEQPEAGCRPAGRLFARQTGMTWPSGAFPAAGTGVVARRQ
ncbi:MAG: hypothetical protein R3E68_07965 [Burkholderiaceae bacterium]